MKIFKHFILVSMVDTLMVAASSSASAHPRHGLRGGFFFDGYPNYYDNGFYRPLYRPAPWRFGYYRGGPRRGFSIGIGGRFGFGFQSDRGRRGWSRDHRHDRNRRNRHQQRRND